MRYLFAALLGLCALFNWTAPAQAQPCQWQYEEVAGIATASYCGNVNVAGTINVQPQSGIIDLGTYAHLTQGVTELKVTATSGNATVTLTSGTVTSSDIGKDFVVFGAGTSDASLYAKITAVPDNTHATLSIAPGTSQTDVPAEMGVDALLPLQTAIDTLTDQGYKNFQLVGTYLFVSHPGLISEQSLWLHGDNTNWYFQNSEIHGTTTIADPRDMTKMQSNVTLYAGVLKPMGDAAAAPAAATNAIGSTICTHCKIVGGTVYARSGTRILSWQTNQYWGMAPFHNLVNNQTIGLVGIGDATYPATTGIDIGSGMVPGSTAYDNMIDGLQVDATMINTLMPLDIYGDPVDTVYNNKYNLNVNISGSTNSGTDYAAIIRSVKNSVFNLKGNGINGRGLYVTDLDSSNVVSAVLSAGSSPSDYGAVVAETASGDTDAKLNLSIIGGWTSANLLPQANGAYYQSLYMANCTLGIADSAGPFQSIFGNVSSNQCTTPYDPTLLVRNNVWLSDLGIVDGSFNVSIDTSIAAIRLKDEFAACPTSAGASGTLWCNSGVVTKVP